MPIITISRRSHSGGALLAQELSSRLGWKSLSQEDVSAAAATAYRMTEKELFQGLYLPANFFQRFTHQKDRYLLATQATITQLLPDGNGIYHGLAGQFLFQDAVQRLQGAGGRPDGVPDRAGGAQARREPSRGGEDPPRQRHPPRPLEPADLRCRHHRP